MRKLRIQSAPHIATKQQSHLPVSFKSLRWQIIGNKTNALLQPSLAQKWKCETKQADEADTNNNVLLCKTELKLREKK